MAAVFFIYPADGSVHVLLDNKRNIGKTTDKHTCKVDRKVKPLSFFVNIGGTPVCKYLK